MCLDVCGGVWEILHNFSVLSSCCFPVLHSAFVHIIVLMYIDVATAQTGTWGMWNTS